MGRADSPQGRPRAAAGASLRSTVGIVVLFLALVGAGVNLVLRRAVDPDDLLITASAGQLLFQQHCVECHGEQALGDGPMAASLPAKPASVMEHLGHHTQDQLIRLILAGVPPAMPPAPISEDEVRLVIAHVWSLVPDSLVEGLRAMRDQMEMGDSMAPMPGMGGMDHSGNATPPMGMDHSVHTMPTGDSVPG